MTSEEQQNDPKRAEDLNRVMSWVRDFRKWQHQEKIDPYVVRQGIIMMLEADTDAALANQVNPEELQKFDDGVRAEAQKVSDLLRLKKQNREA